MKFELLVALRYLKAKRKQAVISLITLISIIGVAAGVAALVIALAINAGFREDLQNKLLGAQAHIVLLGKGGGGITDYVQISREVEQMDRVVAAAPSVYQFVLVSSAKMNKGVALKGIIPELETRVSSLGANIVEGSLDNFGDTSIVMGRELAEDLGVFVGDRVLVFSSVTTGSPIGAVPRPRPLDVVAIFSSGLYDFDSSWVYVPIAVAQRLFEYGDVATSIEVKVADEDIYDVPAIGQQIVARWPELDYTHWIETNQSIFQALRLERLVMFITIGLIILVAALNIVGTLIMMVLEKTRDVAILMSMGATPQNIRKVFILQGVIIGVIGTILGLVAGHAISFVADRYELVSLAPEIYSIGHVPFKPNLLDSVIISMSAIAISFLATLYPSAAAARLKPVEALRYE